MKRYVILLAVGYFFFALAGSLSADNQTKLDQYIQADEWTNVFNEAKRILALDPKNARALYGLGLAQHAQEPGGEEAIKNIEKALKLDPMLLPAYLAVEKVYQNAKGDKAENLKRAERWLKKAVQQDSTFIQAWLRLATLIESDLRYDKSVTTLREGLMKNPTSFDLYDAFIKKSLWYIKYKDIHPVLDALISQISHNHLYTIQKAEVLFLQGHLHRSRDLLDSLQQYIYKDTKARFYYLRAKIFFEEFQDEEGLQSYWKAVSSIIDSVDARVFLNDVCYIMLTDEYKIYRALGAKEHAEFFSRFWRKRDPDLSTRDNERIPEHYRRLYHARQNYRRFVADRYNETLLERDHYHSGSMDPNRSGRTSTVRNATSGAWIKRGVEVLVGDDLMNTMVSEAIFENRDLDDMGLIYVKHGQWDDWETSTLAQYNVVKNKTVQYYRRGSRPEMLFHFVKNGEMRGWCIESMPHYYINLGRFHPDYARIERNAQMNRRSRDFEFEELDLNTRIIQKTTHDAQVAVKTESSEYDPPGQEIRLPMQFLYFKEGSKVRLEWYYLLMGDRIKMETNETGNQLRYAKFIGLYDEEWTEILSAQRDEITGSTLSPEAWAQSSMVKREQLVIEPGVYNCEIQIKDQISENIAARRDTLHAPGFNHDKLCLSDIILSDAIKPADDNALFRIHDLSFRPHMFWAFDRKKPVGIYFEVYNLSQETSGKATFDVTCTLAQKEKKQSLLKKLFMRRGKNVSIVNQYEGRSPDDFVYINFNFQDQKKGTYDLTVHIHDVNSEEETTKTVEFELL